jgi:transposase-like protein
METRIEIELSGLEGELTVAEVARWCGVASKTINRWRHRFIDAP